MAVPNLNLSSVQLSAVHEIANIGLGHALIALSQMTGRSFNMTIPNVDAVPASTLTDLIGGPEVATVAVLMPYEGDVEGEMAYLFPWESGQRLWQLLLGSAPQRFDEISELHMSVVLEIGNIINSSFLNAISEMTDLKMHATPPAFALDMACSIADEIVTDAEVREAVALAVETVIYDTEEETKGYFVLIPTRETLQTLFERLGIADAA